MPRLKLPQTLKDELASTEKTSTRKKASTTVDPKQTLIGSFFAPITKKVDEEENKNNNGDELDIDDNNKKVKSNDDIDDKDKKTTTTTTTTTTIATRRRTSTESTTTTSPPPPKPTTTSSKKKAAATSATSKRNTTTKNKKQESSSEGEEESENETESETESKSKSKKVIKKPSASPSSKNKTSKKPAASATNKKDNSNNTNTTTRTRTTRLNLDFISDDDESDDNDKSNDNKTINKKRKKVDSDYEDNDDSGGSDYEPDSSETESEELLSDHPSDIDVDDEKEDLDSFSFKPKNKKKEIKKKVNKNKQDDDVDIDEDDIIMKDSKKDEEEEVGEPIVIGSGRVILPAGTPDFQPDPKAGKKLLKAHLEIQSKEEEKRQQQQQQQQGGKKGSDDEEEEEEVVKKPTAKKGAKNSAASKKSIYTPLEQQFINIKKDNPDTVLMVECGYKYKFFGDDAEVANKVLNIYSYVVKNFLNASIPIQRLYFHLRRLVMAGYKVGIVEQTETAALKAISSSKSQPFERKLTRVYTSSTFIDDDVDDISNTNSSPQYLIAFYENPNKSVLEKKKLNKQQQQVNQGDEEQNSSNNIINTNISLTSESVSSTTDTISFVAVSIRTGEIIYDTFKDNVMRNELETILTHTKPSEILTPPSILSTSSKKKDINGGDSGYKFSKLTSKCLKSYSRSNVVRNQVMDSQIYDYDYALGKLIDFYENCNSEDVLDHVKSIMNKEQIICLGVLLSYLNQFIHFDTILRVPSNFKAFRVSNHLVLPHSTIVNLEILANESDNTEKGSLVWLLNRTSTFSGSRMFTNWICKPLNQLSLIKERQDAVSELVNGLKVNSSQVSSIISLFKSHIPDLQRNLSRIYYKVQCTPKEFLNTMSSLKRIVELFKQINNNNNNSFNSILLNQIFKLQLDDNDDDQMTDDNNNQINNNNDKITKRIIYFLSNINSETAKEYSTVNCDKSDLWLNLDKYLNIKETKEKIKLIENKLNSILKNIRNDLKKPSLEFLNMPRLNLEYLIELPPSFKTVPKTWIKVNSTQKAVRYQTPEILEEIKLLQQHRETLKLQSQEAWILFLGEFTQDYSLFSNFVHKISNLDCLFSLAKISSLDGYVLPQFVDNVQGGIQIENGRHPVVETILSGTDDTYVPNSIELSESGVKSMIITGPNMGGKSSLLRQTALIVIMAQIGCFVPATSCKLSVFDAIYTRMGARDSIGTGKSTFFIELQETSEILRYSTPNTLVILDELGRGTSTNDGVAIAYSTLKYIVEQKKCYCLFVTHYPLLAQLELQYPKQVGNYHMGYIEEKQQQQQPQQNDNDDQENSATAIASIPKVIFLYKLVRGAAQNSYGLNIGRLAGLPQSVLIEASKKSNEMKESITKRANLSSQPNNQQEIEIQNEIKSIIKNWNSNSLSLNSNDLNQFIDKFKSIQLKLK